MDEQKVLETLRAIETKGLTLESALAELIRHLEPQRAEEAYKGQGPLDFAQVDVARKQRQGVAEVIFGEGKSAEQIIEIASVLREAKQSVMVTRVDSDKAATILARVPSFQHDKVAGILYENHAKSSARFAGSVGIVAAGTSDLAVVREAQITLELNGENVETFVDVGVAGLHRLLRALPDIQKMSALICVAGMEGALGSVLGGLTRVPLICVPTSVGYGAAFGGLSALSGMLTSCASGASVVNIDNGFGAAMAVLRIGDLVQKELKSER